VNKGYVKPDDLEPEITGFQFYYDAFRELSTARVSGFSIGPIPFTAVVDYFTIYNIDGDFDEFASIIRRMDDVYLELNANEMKASENKGKEKSASTNSNKKNPNQS
jgi:hypothetical protein